ncbi:MAG TPA: hypothetical protein VIK78_07260 [Ruminiclostridium sp.]
MNGVTLITNDIDLYNVFLDSKLFDEVNIASSLDEKAEYNYLIVSDRLCGTNDLIQNIENGMKTKKIMYLLSSSKGSQSGYTALTALLKSHNINVFPPALTENQILSRFCDSINLQERRINNVIVLFGADSKVGTTLTALSIAENLAAQSEGSIAFLNLAGHISFSYVDSNDGKGLDSIKSKVFNKILSQDELREAMLQSKECKNLFILPPCRSLIDFKYYQTEHIEYVINMAANMFDVVIVDAGWYPHNALYFGALNATPNKYMVTTQQQASLSNHLIIKQQALDEYGVTLGKNDNDIKKVDSPNNIMLIVNRFNELWSTNITKEYDMVFAISLPNIPMAFYQAESEKKSLRGLSKQYDKQLDKLTNLIALQIEYKLTTKKKTRRFFT